MEPPTTGQEATGHDESPVHNWRVSQLERLGVELQHRLATRHAPKTHPSQPL